MSDPVQVMLAVIKSDDVAMLRRFEDGVAALMNRRNSNIFWRALIDNACQLAAQGCDPERALAMSKLFIENRLPLNDPLDNGDLPFNVLATRSISLGLAAIDQWPVDLNVSDRSGNTPALHCLQLTRSVSLGGFDNIIKMIWSPSFKLDAKDQGAVICFKGLSWLAVASAAASGENKALRYSENLVSALVARGYDFNAARETSDTKFGVPINTPLAYCIKKTAQWLEWNTAPARVQRMGDSMAEIVRVLIAHGADPSLQMEKEQHIALMELCRRSHFKTGTIEALEAGVLGLTVPCVRSERLAARRL